MAVTESEPKGVGLFSPGRIFYGWWVLAAGCVIMGLSSGVVGYAATIFFIPVSAALGLSRAATSLATSVARLETSAFSFLIGYAIDRFGPRRPIIFGMTLMGVGLICFGLFARSLVTFILTWSFMVALGGSIGGFPPIWAAINNWFVRRKGQAMGLGMAAQSLGGLIIAPTLALLISLWGWRSGAVVMGIVILVVTLPLSRVMRTRPSDMGLLPDGDSPQAKPVAGASATLTGPLSQRGPGGRNSQLITNFSLKQALRTPAFWFLNGGLGMRQLVQGGMGLHLSPLLQDVGYSGVQAASLIGVLAFIGIFGAMAIGWLSDHFERRKVAGAVIAIEALSLFCLYLADGGWMVYVFLAGYGFAIGVHTMNRVILGDYFGQSHYARLWGILGMTTLPLGIIGPLFAGWMFDRTESYHTVLLVFAAVEGVGALLYYNCRRPKAPSAPGEPAGAATAP